MGHSLGSKRQRYNYFETDDFETLTKLTKTGCIQFMVFAIRNRRERSVREDQSVMYPPNSADEPPCWTYVNDGFIFGQHDLSNFLFAKMFFDPLIFLCYTIFIICYWRWTNHDFTIFSCIQIFKSFNSTFQRLFLEFSRLCFTGNLTESFTGWYYNPDVKD